MEQDELIKVYQSVIQSLVKAGLMQTIHSLGLCIVIVGWINLLASQTQNLLWLLGIIPLLPIIRSIFKTRSTLKKLKK